VACAALHAQTVASSIVGTVIDTSNGVIQGAEVKVIDQGTRTTRTVTTDALGSFRLSNIAPSIYCLAITREGFKTWAVVDVSLSSGETRDMGRIKLEVGSVNEQMAVNAEATPVQTKSSEKSSLVDGEQLNRIPLKGRDLFGFMSLIPGVLDTTNRDVTSPTGVGGVTINGNPSAKNFIVDGITDMDTGSNTTIHYEPNMDSVQELKVLTANYQAEYGRNSGGEISVVTKSGTRDFHGAATWNHRHEEFDANTFFNNRSGIARTPYRFNVETWSLGGPGYMPWFKRTKNKLFFFVSQEYTGQAVAATTQYRYVPTSLEREGNFSQSYTTAGALIKVIDPLNGAQFPGNVIPASRIDPMGLAVLNYMPAPNNPYGVATAGSNGLANQYNFQDAGSSPHTRRNDMARADANPTSKIFAYFRYINDYDDQTVLYQGIQWKTAGVVDHPNPGHGYVASLAYVISPNLINQFTFGKSFDTWDYFEDDPASVDRSDVGNIPFLFQKTLSPASDHDAMHNYVPSISFGTTPSNPAAIGTGTAEYFNSNDIWTVQDNFTANRGRHTVKGGIYVEKTFKLQPIGDTYAGTLSFAVDANNPLNTGDGYANALLGNYDTYAESTLRTTFNAQYWNVEFYLQDNWRVTRRLTVDMGMRFYHQSPQVDLNHTFAYFNPALYSAAAMPRIYVPAFNAAGQRVAKDPGTGTLEPVSYIGLFVPNTGNPSDGMVVAGKNGASPDTYTTRALEPAPRLGFAYDVFGNGKTAIRGGFGYYFNRLDTNQVDSMSGQEPVAFTQTSYYGSLSTLGSSAGLYSPGAVSFFAGKVPFDYVRNGSIGVQQALPGGMVLEAAYVTNWNSKQDLTVNINPIPLGADFMSQYADPTLPGKPLTGALERPAYPGYTNVTEEEFVGHSNYNSLQVTLTRRYSRGLMYGVSYAWAHALGVTAYDPLVANNDSRNYGALTTDRRQTLVFYYGIDLPKPGKHYHSKPLSAVADNWTLSGVTTISTGAPFSPTCTSSAGTDITGSASETARCLVVGNSQAPGPAGTYFNTAAFALPSVGSIGNLGVNALTGPGYTNLDATMQKYIHLWGEHAGLKIQFQGYNILNHTEYSTYTSSATFSATGAQTNGSFGEPSATRAARILAASLRLEF
jgi:hypothetical protein